MGKKLDVLLGRSFKSSKFKTLTNLAISRLAVLKNQRQARFSMARNDVVQLLNLGHHERALLRVDQVIKEQNMLDAFVMMEGYCILLSERVKVIEHDKGCPDELKEAIASLIFAASRCGEFPELQEIRAVFTSRFGKEFTCRATELRNSCGVNTKLIQKLSPKQSSLDERMKILKEIADKNGTALQLEESPSIAAEEKLNTVKTQSASFDSNEHGDELRNFHEEIDGVERFSNSMNTKKQYKDVADAAQEAFMSAAYAAAAARAAVELSRSYPRAPDNPNDPKNPRKQQIFDSNDEVKSRHQTSEKDYPGKTENAVSDNEVMKEEIEVGPRSSSMKFSGAQEKDKELPKGVTFEEGDDEAKSETLSSHSDDNPWIERGTKLQYFSQKQSPSSIQDGSSIDDNTNFFAGLAGMSAQRMNTEKRPFSVRTRR